MAEEMNGIMSLSGQEEGEQVDPSLFRPEITSYALSNPVEFGENILQGMEETDPELLREFREVLARANLPPEAIDALGQMVDAILDDPENYDEARRILLEEGVPEDLLPEQFDLAFFTALNIALDQVSTAMPGEAMPEDEFEPFPIERAEGGIATMKPMADAIARMGRNGDTMLAHVTPSEARMLRRRGGSGTINPDTGLPEFFIGKVFKAIGKAVKGVIGVVGKVVKGVVNVVKKVAKSPIGKIALTAAGIWALGPAGLNLAGGIGSTFGLSMTPALAMGINTFAANTVVNLAGGQKLGEAVKNGAIAGVLAGGASKLTGWAPESYQTAYGEPLTNINALPDMPGDIAARAGGEAAGEAGGLAGDISMKDALMGTGGEAAGEAAGAAAESGGEGSFLTKSWDWIKDNPGKTALLGGGALLAANAMGGEGSLFEGEPSVVPPGLEGLARPQTKTGVDLYNEFPEYYDVNLSDRNRPRRAAQGGYIQQYNMGGPAFPMNDAMPQYSPNQMSVYGGSPMSQFPASFAQGGNVPDPRNPDNFPRRNGAIAGPGTPTSDSIPAMLSDGEFVFTKKAVDGAAKLANGGMAPPAHKSRRDGAREMYALMKTLEDMA
jgi:hypothetical protein